MLEGAVTEKFSLATAARYLSDRLGVRVSERTLYMWLRKGYVQQRFRNPGPRGHYFFTKELLDEIVEKMKGGGGTKAC